MKLFKLVNPQIARETYLNPPAAPTAPTTHPVSSLMPLPGSLLLFRDVTKISAFHLLSVSACAPPSKESFNFIKHFSRSSQSGELQDKHFWRYVSI